MQQVQKKKYIMTGLAVLLLVCIVTSFVFGRYPVPIRELFGILYNRFCGLFEGEVPPFWTKEMETAVWNVRLPRILMSVVVGASLSAAGAAYQGVFQNPMASPDILGASAGAGFGAAVAILMEMSTRWITGFAFVTGLLAVGLVFCISQYTKGERILGLILSGIMIGSLFQAGTSFIKLVADPSNKLPQITYWLMGSLSGAKWSELKFVALPILIGLITLHLLRWKLNVLTVGDDEASTMGVNAGKVRFAVATAATLVIAASVSVSGMIGWVGLVVPHIMRKIVGSDYRWLMPSSMFGGAVFLLTADNISRNVGTAGIPIGILTAFVGAPFFLWLITGRRKQF